MDDLKIGLKIRSRRTELKMTQEELAEDSNSSINFISQLERGEKNNVSLRKINDIANALKLNIVELLTYNTDDRVELSLKADNLDYLPYTKELLKQLLSQDQKMAETLSKSILTLINSKNHKK